MDGQLKWVAQHAGQNNVLAIGECGLDRVCGSDWAAQVDVFRQQIAIANEVNKPLIIHCVRAFEELVEELDKAKVKVPVIIHGYNRKREVATRLLEKGYYLSFGAAILNDSFPAVKVLQDIPAGRFFLETDDSDLSIKDIYKKAAEIRKTGEDALILQVAANFNTVFKR